MKTRIYVNYVKGGICAAKSTIKPPALGVPSQANKGEACDISSDPREPVLKTEAPPPTPTLSRLAPTPRGFRCELKRGPRLTRQMARRCVPSAGLMSGTCPSHSSSLAESTFEWAAVVSHNTLVFILGTVLPGRATEGDPATAGNGRYSDPSLAKRRTKRAGSTFDRRGEIDIA